MNTVSRLLRLLAIISLVWCLAPNAALGGSQADSIFGIEKFGEQPIRNFALKVNDELDAKKVNVAIIARSGRPRRFPSPRARDRWDRPSST